MTRWRRQRCSSPFSRSHRSPSAVLVRSAFRTGTLVWLDMWRHVACAVAGIALWSMWPPALLLYLYITMRCYEEAVADLRSAYTLYKASPRLNTLAVESTIHQPPRACRSFSSSLPRRWERWSSCARVRWHSSRSESTIHPGVAYACLTQFPALLCLRSIQYLPSSVGEHIDMPFEEALPTRRYVYFCAFTTAWGGRENLHDNVLTSNTASRVFPHA